MSKIYKLIENDSIVLTVPLSGCSKNLDRKELKDILIETMKEYQGIGLSANQCGVMERVFVFYENFIERKAVACFNPKIVDASKVEVLMQEGCLTYPGLWLKLRRPEWIQVEFEDEDGKMRERKYSNLEGRIFQHEMDHMEGSNFTKLASKLKLGMSMKRRDKQLKKSQLIRP